ncbi:MAG: DNA translocase FtsK [Gemmatimonadetes bacterium]|nr:DNA translocase FtsK [Gemmatimonadota bacterium]
MSDRSRRLVAISSLALGVFLALTLLPVAVTGPLGRVLGVSLWKSCGVGAPLIPVLLVAVGVAGLGAVRHVDLWRVTLLIGGLVILLPLAVAIVVGLAATADLPPSYDQWPLRYRLVGFVAAFMTVSIVGIVGTAGAVIVELSLLSALVLLTTRWRPFRWLDRRESAAVKDRKSYEATFGELERPERKGLAKLKAPLIARKSAATDARASTPLAAADEQAFITEAAIEPFPLELLDAADPDVGVDDEAELDRLGHVLIATLKTFKVDAVLGRRRSTGPVVTQFEVAPAAGVKVGRIAALADDLALKMEAKSIRIVAPIPGKAFVGVEVPNPTPRMVVLSELLSAAHWDPHRPGLPIALGRDLEGKPVTADLTKMPHLLIAGATGSGKSVCINTIITSLVHRYNDRQLQLLMIDPKMVELAVYNALPHMRHEVVTDNKDAAKALKWAMYQMEDRYVLFSLNNVRNLHEFNRKVKEGREVVMPRPERDLASDDPDQLGLGDTEPSPIVPYDGSTLPFIVVIVEELADLMMTVQAEVEKPLAILAQKARATGIHLVLATQRPSVNVITGLIKANFPSRIAFRVASKVDSRTILDQNGAETLLGNGDMLFLPPGMSEPVRLQGAYIETQETERVTTWYAEQRASRERDQGVEAEAADIIAEVLARESREEAVEERSRDEPAERDSLFREAAEVCLRNGGGSTSLLQRKLRIGYGRAARVVDQLHDAGILGPPDGSKPREVVIGAHQLDEYCR